MIKQITCVCSFFRQNVTFHEVISCYFNVKFSPTIQSLHQFTVKSSSVKMFLIFFELLLTATFSCGLAFPNKQSAAFLDFPIGSPGSQCRNNYEQFIKALSSENSSLWAWKSMLGYKNKKNFLCNKLFKGVGNNIDF